METAKRLSQVENTEVRDAPTGLETSSSLSKVENRQKKVENKPLQVEIRPAQVENTPL